MQFEDFDKKVREAADNHHPVYNENAWPQMEKLLDKHLPQKEDNRRRFIFFLLLLIGLSGGLWLIGDNAFNKESNTTAERSSDNNTTTTPIATNASSGKQKDANISQHADEKTLDNETAAISNTTDVTAVNSKPVVNLPAKASTSSASNFADPSAHLSFSTSKGNKKGRSVSINNSGNQKELATDINTIPVTKYPVSNTDESNAAKTTIVHHSPQPPENNKKQDETDIKKESTNVLDTDKPIATAKEKTSPKTNRKGFAILFAAGIDKSSVGFAKAGTTKPIFGAGISYTYKKFTLSSGVYSSKKIYTAAPADYKFGYNPPNYIYLKSINADCNVLDIPINIAWNFIEGKKGSWFVSTGVSSMIMKNEKYGYLYKYPNGQSYTHKQEYDNKNQHLFSTLNLSAGYKRYIGKSFLISAETYLKLPVKGVGAGKINLHSSGIMITAGIQPFNFRK